MALEAEATYESGVPKLNTSLPLDEYERVIVQVRPHKTRSRRNAGFITWTGDPEVLRKIVENPKFRVPDSPIVGRFRCEWSASGR